MNDPEELFDIPGKYRCSYVAARMDHALVGNIDQYQQYAEVPHEPFIATGKEYKYLLVNTMLNNTFYIVIEIKSICNQLYQLSDYFKVVLKTNSD